mmetsp:Transcript_43445/g.86209  ORF Transcript_43445/g.86209 Transcript_43445/m.86209 type:complete len:218 (-) Transcript_43445:478-1131(-)
MHAVDNENHGLSGADECHHFPFEGRCLNDNVCPQMLANEIEGHAKSRKNCKPPDPPHREKADDRGRDGWRQGVPVDTNNLPEVDDVHLMPRAPKRQPSDKGYAHQEAVDHTRGHADKAIVSLEGVLLTGQEPCKVPCRCQKQHGRCGYPEWAPEVRSLPEVVCRSRHRRWVRHQGQLHSLDHVIRAHVKELLRIGERSAYQAGNARTILRAGCLCSC